MEPKARSPAFAVVIVLVVFMLLERLNLRDRLLRMIVDDQDSRHTPCLEPALV